MTPIVLVFVGFLMFKMLWIVAQMVKNLLSMQETWVRSLGGEDPLEKGMATHSRILAWRIPWTEEPGGLQSMGTEKMWTRLSAHPFINLLDICIFSACGWGSSFT